jgi:hypothetical protein
MAVETAPGLTKSAFADWKKAGMVFFNPAQAGFGSRSRDFSRQYPKM